MKRALSIVAAILLASCQSAPGPIPADASAEIYFQRGLSASDQSQFSEALSIYQTFLKNRTDATHDEQFRARYEIAVLLKKMDRVSESIEAFQSIIDDYENLEKSSGAPAWVKNLSQKLLKGLKELETKPKS